MFTPAQSYHLGRCHYSPDGLSAPGPLYYRPGILSEASPASAAANRWLHSNRYSPCPLRDPGCERTNRSRRSRLSLSRGSADAIRDVFTTETRLRIDRPTRQRAGGPCLARSLVGIHLFVSGRKIFHQVAERNSLPGQRCFWQTARARIRRYRHRSRRTAQARRILLQPPAFIVSTSCRRLSARLEATPI